MKWCVVAGLTAGLMAALCSGFALEGSAGPKEPFIGAEVPGITDTQIILGSHFALTGSYAALCAPIIEGLEAYFRYVNAEEGGVCGREIVLKVEDDSSDPAKAVEAVHKLVEQDGVFAIVAGLGTAAHSAVWEYLNERGVPDLWIMSGAHKWAAEPQRYPWSVAIAPDYYVEGTIFGRYISEYLPGKKVAVLYQNDEFGWDELAGLKNGLDPNKNELVSEQSYETVAVDIRPQVTNLKNAGAEVVLLASLPGFTAQAVKQGDRLGWYPQFFVSYVSSDPIMFQFVSPELMEGVISLQANKMHDSTDDPAVAEHHRIMNEYGGPTPSSLSIVGQSAGALTVEALSRTCDNLTREGLMEAVHSFEDYQGDLTLPGITITLSETDHLAIEAMRMLRAVVLEGEGKWEYFGPIFSFSSDWDGFPDAVELFMGTDPVDGCADDTIPNNERGPAYGEPLSPWPPDFNDNGRIEIGDLVGLKNHWVPLGNPYSVRYDLNANGLCDTGDLVVLRYYWRGTGRETCTVG